MEAVTTIYGMIATNNIYVPDYQRSYSWDTQTNKNLSLQVNVFLDDLNNYILTDANTKYYFGHFLFENKENNLFAIIDGQQRLTTIIIFLSALFRRLKDLGLFNDDDEEIYENLIKRKNRYPFSTVKYDNQFFQDYVIDNKKNDKSNLDTVSKKRIVNAYDFLWKKVKNLNEKKVRKYLNTILNASCTTHRVDNEAEAIQMFIFQNNRGKQPTLLEIIKAQFLYNIHISKIDIDDKLSIIQEIRNRFEEIYKNISKIEDKVSEDDVLLYTLKIYFNSLWADNPKETIEPELKKTNETDKINFIRNFTLNLSNCFNSLTIFFNKEKHDIDIHSLFISGQNSILFPFIIKAILNNIDDHDLKNLSNALESIFIRSRVIGTRADLRSRLNDVFQNFDIDDIIERINWMKQQDGWYGYWNNESFKSSLQGYINPAIAKILLWKYENNLLTEGSKGYNLIRYDSIDNPQLEHIAPQTENPSKGYDEYDEEFMNEYLECLGNYLLLSSSHNESIGNIPFINKLETYNMLKQQEEIVDMTINDKKWTRNKIKKRKNKIIKFITNNF